MDLQEAERIARQLIQEHIPADEFGFRWNFKWDRAKRRAGVCKYSRRIIGLSKPLTLLRSEEMVRDTILHEIAHALVPNDNHGPQWQRKAREIGCNGERRFNDVHIEGKWRGTCEQGHVVTRHRRPTHRHSCTICFPYQFNEDYLITWEHTA